MNKLYVIKQADNTLVPVYANFTPPGSVGEMPKDEQGNYEKVDYVSLEMVENEQGQMEQRLVVNEQAKSAYLAQKQAEADAKAAADAATQYQRDRRAAYPSIGDQLDAIYKKFALNDPTEYDAIAAEIAAVKQQFPKPE